VDEKTSNPTQAKEQPGFYDEQFLKGELDDLRKTSLNSLQQEIHTLRILGRRLLSKIQDDTDADKTILISQVISKINHEIARLAEIQKKLSGGENTREYIIQNLAAMFESFSGVDFYLPPVPPLPTAREE
jgi:hypothetical protein